MHQQHTTGQHAYPDRKRYWQGVIRDAYFNLQLSFENTDTFDGTLECWDFGTISVSRLSTNPLSYKRLDRYCTATEDSYLITIPETSEIHFQQMRRDIWCPPGGFILEDSNEPFLFEYPKSNTMWVLKIPGETLRTRLRNPSPLCAIAFDASSSAASLFIEYLKFLMARWEYLPREVRSLMSQHLVDLLAVALEFNPNIVHSEQSAVREGHLRRIEVYIRGNLQDPELSPSSIANACGLSSRYLHMLFRGAEYSVSEWIRELRLQAAREFLERCPASTQIAAVAYQWGFSDQAGFSNAFKHRFDITPSEFKAKIRKAS